MFAWLIYDFANSFVATSIGGLFLAQWVVFDMKLDDIWYGTTFVLATILTLIAAPFFGVLSDSIGRKLPFLKYSTYILIFILTLLSIIAPLKFETRTRVLVVLLLAMLLQFVYQISLIFYNSLLEQVSTKKTRGKISGLGEAFGSFGFIVASFILVYVVNSGFALWGEPGRMQVFLPSLVVFIVLSIPILKYFKEKTPSVNSIDLQNVQKSYLSSIRSLINILKHDKNGFLFLVSFFLISDGIQTLQLYYAIILETIYKLTDYGKVVFMGVSFITIIFGTYFFGKLSDLYNAKKVLIYCSIHTCFFILLFVSGWKYALYLMALFGGLGISGYYSVARAMLVKIAPSKNLAEYFSLYSVFQRFSSILGPLLWGFVTLVFRNHEILKYQAASVVLIVLVLIGVVLLQRVKLKKAVL